jgi:hypothetical protein
MIDSDTTDFTVAVLDQDGYETGRTVTVWITYHVDIDPAYGADADGRRGIKRIDYMIDRIECHDAALTTDERKQVETDAEAMFYRLVSH